MIKKAFILLLSFHFISCESGKLSQPNVVIIFTDDQGYGDLSCYGSKSISTPILDNLANHGMRFTDFHVSSSICTPSRASLLTGCYPDRIGLPMVLFPDGSWGSKDNIGINPDEETLAELFQSAGYTTAMAGKWHLGHRKMFLPLQHGFDTYFGIPYSNDMARGSLALVKDNETIEIEPNQANITKRYTEFCVDFISKSSKESPFFLYLAHTMPHTPIYASEEFKGRSEGGLYGDVIEEIDWSSGEIIKALKEKGVLDNTLIIFTSDNGPWLSFGNHGGSAGALRGGKFDVFEGGFRVPAIMSWPGVIPEGTTNNKTISTLDILPTLCHIAELALPSKKIDGTNIYPLLIGNEMPELDNRLFYYFSNSTIKAVRKGHWKYIAAHTTGQIVEPGSDGKNGKTERIDLPEALYNLNTDIREEINLINQYPEIAVDLKKSLNIFQSKIQREARLVGISTTN